MYSTIDSWPNFNDPEWKIQFFQKGKAKLPIVDISLSRGTIKYNIYYMGRGADEKRIILTRSSLGLFKICYHNTTQSTIMIIMYKCMYTLFIIGYYDLLVY